MMPFSKRLDTLYDKKSGISHVTSSHNYAEAKIDSDDDLPLEKHWVYIILSCLLSHILIKIKIKLRCGKTKALKEELYGAKKQKKQ